MTERVATTREQFRAAIPDVSAWVNANAGSGKTHVLVNRIARLLLAGADPASIICLTYTKAAAKEMEARVNALFGSWTFKSDKELGANLRRLGVTDVDRQMLARARKLFTLAQETPGGFKIQTIHAFCEKILQLFPVEAGVAPGFSVLDEERKKALMRQARDQVLGGAMAEPDSSLGRAMALVSRHSRADDLDTLVDMLLPHCKRAAEGAGDLAAQVTVALKAAFGLPKDARCAELSRAMWTAESSMIARCADVLLGTANKTNHDVARKLAAARDAIDDDLRVTAIREFCFKQDLKAARSTEKLVTAEIKTAHPWLHDFVLSEHERLTAEIEAYDALQRIEATAALLEIALDIATAFETAKSALGLRDFDDLIALAHSLLTERQSAEWILYKLDKGVEHILIDEAQDTSPAQWGIIEALAREFHSGAGSRPEQTRTLFVVGDPKQSIFSFHGADTAAFLSSHAMFGEAFRSASLAFHDINLTVSFRSTAQVLGVVDQVFANGMPAREGLGIGGGDGLMHETTRRADAGMFELWPLLTVDKDALGDPWEAPTKARLQVSHHRALARKIARTVKGWIGTRRLASTTLPVKASDILILFRSRSPLFYSLINELRVEGVAVAGADRLKPVENIAVMDVLALIDALTLPVDDYALACVLKSPLISTPISEEGLFNLAHEREGATLWHRLAASANANDGRAHAELLEWQALMRQAKPFEFLDALLMKRRAAIVARLGTEASDALDALLEAALAYEGNHPPSIVGFAAWFRSGDATVKRDMESGHDEVRLMTVHGAKGLEANIVIIPDTVSTPESKASRLLLFDPTGQGIKLPLWRLTGLSPSRHLDRWQAAHRDSAHEEYCRLLYVAMTRARDELYICGSHGKAGPKDGCWYGMVAAALKDKACGLEFRTTLHPDGAQCLRHGGETA
jgi:ATP-dependent helicase/nuclease subunit A